MHSCEHFELLISLAVDGEATAEEQSQLEHHMASCPDCRAYYADIQRIHRAFIRGDAAVPEGFSKRIMDRVRETKQDPGRSGKKKTVLFPHWRRWGALAACCALTALCVWCVWEAGGRNIITRDSAPESTESPDMRSMGSGLQAARSMDSADFIEEDEDVGPVLMDLDDETPPPGPEAYEVSTGPAAKVSAAEEDGQSQPMPAPAMAVSLTPIEEPEWERDSKKETETPYSAEDDAERDEAAAVSADLPLDVADMPEPGIVTAFGSAAQSWVEDVLGAPWAGGGSYPLTAEQYSDLLRTLDEAGEPYRLEPGDGYCLLTE